MGACAGGVFAPPAHARAPVSIRIAHCPALDEHRNGEVRAESFMALVERAPAAAPSSLTETLKTKLEGCYVTVPTPFVDAAGFPVDETALREYVRFLIAGGLDADTATFLAGGAAGDFSTMTFDERMRVAEVVIDEVGGRVPVAVGAQTTSTLELVRIAKTAKRLGADFIQVSCPFYFTHTEGDFEEFIRAAAEAAPDLGLIVYNTFWTSTNISFGMVERLAEIPNVVGLKWATPRTDAMEFEDVTSHFSDRFTIIDNNLFFAYSATPALGAKAFEVHLCNYWPEWGLKLVEEVRRENFAEIARMLVDEAMPFYKLWVKIEREFTSGDGYLDKLCMELVGLPSSRCRPPTRDVRERYRADTLAMMRAAGVPRLRAS
jgi:dihydrodipicolinate synthase/N-acetylneuraminate lyase